MRPNESTHTNVEDDSYDQSTYPRAVEAITNHHYVDDYLDSSDTSTEGQKFFQ